MLDSHARIEQSYASLLAEPWSGDYRVVKGNSSFEGYSFMRIFDAGCSRAAMLRELEAYMGTKETVTFGSDASRYDVAIPNSDRNLLVRELKRRFEPVDLRCWKSIFRR